MQNIIFVDKNNGKQRVILEEINQANKEVRGNIS